MMFAHLLKGILVTLTIVGASLSLPDAPRAADIEREAGEQDFCDTDFNGPPEDLVAKADEVDPMALICAVRQYWERGDRLKAAFWYRIWIIRTDPWVRDDWEFDVVRDVMGGQFALKIGEWAASDLTHYVELLDRAHAYEAKLPLSPLKPSRMSQQDWDATVAQSRKDLKEQHVSSLQPGEIEAINQQRAALGQYIGPFKEPGSPLREDWR